MSDENKFYQHVEYLNKWKPALDAKAVNPIVHKALKAEIKQRGRIRVLDCGTGTGRGLIKLIEEGTLKQADIEAFDISQELLADMPRLFQEYAAKWGWVYHPCSPFNLNNFTFEITDQSKGINIRVHGFKENAYELTKRGRELSGIDLIIGQAFIEHVNQGIVYPILTMLLNPGGLIYFSMNCDGWFNYSPSEDRERDEKMVALFNDLILNNQEFKNNFGSVFGGEAFCGRNLPYRFREYGLEVIAFGPSDWVVTPFQQTEEELEFLKYTSMYIRDKCTSTETAEARERRRLTKDDVYQWHTEKVRAIGDGSIGFTCVQKDILGRKK